MTTESPRQREEPGWTIGHVEDIDGRVSYVEGRELTDEHVAAYREAVSFVVEHQEQPALQLVLGNYQEYRALEAALAMALTAPSMQTTFPRGEHLFQLRRVLLNWLTSVRLFDDHSRARLTRLYGKLSSQVALYAEARSTAYDDNPSYRFMFELRNYAQHCGMVPVQGHIQVDTSGRRLALYFDRDQLLSEFHNWKKVKSDLVDGPDQLVVDDHLESAMTTVIGLTQAVREIDRDRFNSSAEIITEIVGPLPENLGRRPAIFRIKHVEPRSEELTIESLPVFVPMVRREVTGGTAEQNGIPNFRAERPMLQVERQDYTCQGPINKVTHLPGETCSERATNMFYFPHQQGIAFVFGCDEHALTLGRWIGQRFGGCFGDSVLKTPLLMEQAAERFARVDLPHGEEFNHFLPAQNPPQAQSPLVSG